MSGQIIPAPPGATVITYVDDGDVENPGGQTYQEEFPIVAVVLDAYDSRVSVAITTHGTDPIPVGPGKAFVRWEASA